MAMYTEFFFRAHLKKTTPEPLLTWFEQLADDPLKTEPFDDHPFFHGDWTLTVAGGSAVYQISRQPQFVRATESYEDHELILMASATRIDDASFLDWIRPHLNHLPGDFLGYTLYEDTRGCDPEDEDREQPDLIFMLDKTATR